MLVDKTRNRKICDKICQVTISEVTVHFYIRHISHSESQIERKSHHQSQFSESTPVSQVISEVIFSIRGRSHHESQISESNHFGIEVEVTVLVKFPRVFQISEVISEVIFFRFDVEVTIKVEIAVDAKENLLLKFFLEVNVPGFRISDFSSSASFQDLDFVFRSRTTIHYPFRPR